MRPQPPLYYLHIPKTGGTAANAALDSLFEPEEIFPPQLLHDVLPLPAAQISGYRFYRGHFGLALPELLAEPVELFTILREPCAQAISYYHHIQRNAGHWLHATVMENKMNFAEFVKSPLTAGAISNPQSRNLAFKVDLPTLRQWPREAQCSFRFVRELEQWSGHECDDSRLLSKAQATIDRCLCVGLTDQLDESLRRLAIARGVQPPASTQRLNCAPERVCLDDLPQETQQRLRQLTAVDQQLYASAMARFQAETDRYQQAA